MKGLILKDMCVFARKMKAYFLMMIVFAAIPNGSLVGFAVMYSGMLPITALAYDENSKWDELAAMMPYSVFQLVFSKYALGYILTLAAAAVSFVIHSAVVLIMIHSVWGYLANPLTLSFPLEMTVYISVSFIITALDLPIILRFGTEKGRWIFMFLTIGIAMLCVNNIDYLILLFGSIDGGSMKYLALFPAAALLVNALSVPLALGSYKKRYRK